MREKLCTRINARENATEYFLTVFEKKNFGNEKIYEKRLNFRKKALSEYELQMHPTGGYVYFKFNLNLGDYNYSKFFHLVFPLTAQYKDPLMLKNDGHFIGF